ncbi:MAG: T9SS type A sorting domain-containing protein [Bacteroidales bacterium]|nr:T9SS type A sorting domain-containing protein [Bacteroidales bacterium]
MKKKINLIVFFLFLIGNLFAQKDIPLYSFFTAGHTYGNPNNPHYGLHYPFVDYIPKLNNYSNMQFGVLTGDVVFTPTTEYWEAAQIDIDKFNMPIKIAAGNHDYGTEFTDRFGSYYYSFIQNNDLFFILSPVMDQWNISGEQFDFLIHTLDENSTVVNHIFIFLHELIWWSPYNRYQNIIINFTPQYPGSTNFESIVKPLLQSYPNNFTIYAGDLGATSKVSAIMHDQLENITLIASGMGSGNKDNIIITDVYQDSVQYNLIALNGSNPNALGKLMDYTIQDSRKDQEKKQIEVFPNPCTNYISIINRMKSELNIIIFNIYGQIIYSGMAYPYHVNEIDLSNYSSGLYTLKLFNETYHQEQKIIVNK